ncbi:predicted protein [Naegleria gruberi]|uniref:Predicted protein n=1 Tax=Naegleria gruberi TaxID=5762 RepID=D2VDV8_NAEGR|nr:uncharacterized protein NAEGRDRAFT_33285 [Naegleria gruberi]EFC44970.1 predicted protein [Naegleria gruberi]|eukprot:XP_002677714.1 predicted protein [Naegleria gruberi strain NEG-M]
MTFRNLSSDEVNFMIYRYLQESGFKHSAFSFASESNVQSCGIRGAEVPPGALISFLQKGIQYLEVETKLRNKSDQQVQFDTVFEMLLPDVPKENLKETNSSSNSSNPTNPNNTTTTASTTSTTNTTQRRKNSSSEKANVRTSSNANGNSGTNSSGRPSKKQKQNTTTPATTSSTAVTTSGTSLASNGSHNSLATHDEESAAVMVIDEGHLYHSEANTSTIIPDSLVTKLKGHTHEVFICAWNPARSNVLASGSGDSTARIWELVKDEVGPRAAPLHPLVLNHGDNTATGELQASTKDVTTLDWSGDGKRLATGSYDGKARIWSEDGRLRCILDQHKGPIFSLKWNKAGNYLLSGSVDNTSIVWDVENNQVKQQFAHHSAPTLDVDWRTNTSFATCSTDRMIYVYELGTSNPTRTFSGHEDEVNAIRWSPNGKLLASCSDDFTAKIWSYDSQKCVWDFKEHTKEIYTIKWSPTGPGTDYPNKNTVLASASFDASIKLWDPIAGKCLHSLTKHTDPVYSVAFSPDGKYLASGSFDRYLHIWSVHDGKLVRTYHGSGSIFEVCWNATGDKVAACFSNSITEEFNVCVLDFRM